MTGSIWPGLARRDPVPWALGLLAVLAAAWSCPAAAAERATGPQPRHVFIIVLENEGYRTTFGPKSPAVYLKALTRKGALLPNYYGIGHDSLDNYIAMISGQAPNPVTQDDCETFVEFAQTGVAKDGQAVGSGCVYPAAVTTIAGQLEARGFSWKGYMEDMGADPVRDGGSTCAHPAIGQADKSQVAAADDQYAARHDPFVYFHAIIDRPTCAARVVNLKALAADLQSIRTTPNFAFITPNLCHDGHDPSGSNTTCADHEPGGLRSADAFLEDLVPKILKSPAFRKDGLLIVTFDEADVDTRFDPATKRQTLESGDASACCHEQPGPNIGPGAIFSENTPDKGPGVFGPGGGRIGAVLVSPFITPGTLSKTAYNHYALLRSLEDMFGLDHLGYAGQAGLSAFGGDVFTAKRK